jgi:hypothetical protein
VSYREYPLVMRASRPPCLLDLSQSSTRARHKILN